MIKKLLPDYTVANVMCLDKSFYETHGIKAVIFDIDNTLVRHTQLTPTDEVLGYFDFLKNSGIKYAIVSNNTIERVEAFCRGLGVVHYGKALKPRKKFLKKTIEALGASAQETCLVGDQLFTDMYGANRMKFLSVMVTAVGEDETSFVSFKRKFERNILKKNRHLLKEYKGE